MVSNRRRASGQDTRKKLMLRSSRMIIFPMRLLCANFPSWRLALVLGPAAVASSVFLTPAAHGQVNYALCRLVVVVSTTSRPEKLELED